MRDPSPIHGPQNSAKRKSILIVEDHPATRAAMMTLLNDAFPECRLLSADSGEIALTLCIAEMPTIVIMDIALPAMNGFEATRRIKELSPDTLVVMHSSSDAQIFREESVAAGASAFVAKGRTSIELVSIISEHLLVTAIHRNI